LAFDGWPVCGLNGLFPSCQFADLLQPGVCWNCAGSTLLQGILGSWLFKTAYEALALPITIPWVQHIKRQSGLDVVDRDLATYNPFQEV
jgi:hypothetical protein